MNKSSEKLDRYKHFSSILACLHHRKYQNDDSDIEKTFKKPIYNIVQGWPDFFSQGPFSIICNVLGAANSFHLSGDRGVQNFLKISLQICENHKRFQKCFLKFHFGGEKVKNFFKNGILGGAFYEHYEPP
jgi:hypothetical protein